MEVELSFERDVRMTVNTTVELDVAAMKRWWQDDNLDEPLPEGWPNKHHIEAYVRFCDDFANVPLITPRLAGDHNLDKEIAAILFDGEDVIYSKDNVGTPDDWLITVGWIHTYPWLEAAFEHKDTIDQRGGQVMAEVCNCDEAAEEHEHCQDCDCVLNWNESENYCCWCVERRAKEDEEDE